MSNNTSQKTTLLDFISQNEPSLTVAGIFIAIAAFWLNLPIKPLASFVAFLSIAITIPIFIALSHKISKCNPSLGLLVFSNIFTLIILNIIWYVAVAFRPELKTELSKVLFWLMIIPLYFLYKKYLHEYVFKFFSWLDSLTDHIFSIEKAFSKKRKRAILKKLAQLKIQKVSAYKRREIVKDFRIGEDVNQYLNTISKQDFVNIYEELNKNATDERAKKRYESLIKVGKKSVKLEKRHQTLIYYGTFIFSILVLAGIVILASDFISNHINSILDNIHDKYQNQNRSLPTPPQSTPSPSPTKPFPQQNPL